MLRAATPIAEASTPLHLAHCAPSGWCDKRERCARFDHRLCDATQQRIDGTAVRWQMGVGCPLFVNARPRSQEAA